MKFYGCWHDLTCWGFIQIWFHMPASKVQLNISAFKCSEIVVLLNDYMSSSKDFSNPVLTERSQRQGPLKHGEDQREDQAWRRLRVTYLLYSALIHLHQVNLERKDCALVHNYMLYSCTAPLRWLQLNTSTGAVGTLDKGGQIGDAWGFWGRGWLRGLLPLLFSYLWTNQLECCIASEGGCEIHKDLQEDFSHNHPMH